MKARFPFKALSSTWLIVWFGASLLCLGMGGEHVLNRSLQGPSLLHPLGFDAFGRDMLLTVLRASTLSAGFAAACLAVTLLSGTLAGAGISLTPPALRFALLRALDLLLAFPSLLLALGFAAVAGPGWTTLIVSLILGSIPGFIRLIHTRTKELLSEEYILAAHSFGASPARIVFKHLTPGLLPLCRIKAPNLFAGALMAEASLSFLGIGAPIGRDTWGSLLSQGRDYLIEAPHIALAAGLPLVLTILALEALDFGKAGQSGSLSVKLN